MSALAASSSRRRQLQRAGREDAGANERHGLRLGPAQTRGQNSCGRKSARRLERHLKRDDLTSRVHTWLATGHELNLTLDRLTVHHRVERLTVERRVDNKPGIPTTDREMSITANQHHERAPITIEPSNVLLHHGQVVR